MSEPTLIIWGAGKIGRGPIADMFHTAGWHLVFVRRSAECVRKMRDAGRYTVMRCETGKEPQPVTISGFEAYTTDESEALAEAVIRAGLIVVPTMAPQIPEAARQIAAALLRRRERRPDDLLNILPCANMVNSAAAFRNALEEATPIEAREYFAAKIGVAESLIRIGATDPPGAPPEDDPAQVYARYPGTYNVDRDAFKGPQPEVPGLTWVHDPAAEGMRKIWVGNMSHAFMAYRGWLRGHTLIHECATDPVVIAEGKEAVVEATSALAADARMTQEQVDEALRFYGGRSANPDYPDTIQRVGSDPRRKLGRDDRFLGPLLLARRFRLPFAALARGAACALRYDNPTDPAAVWIQQRIAEQGLCATIYEVCELEPDETDVAKAIIAAYEELGPAPTGQSD